jgi:hypothetical protein
VLTVQHRQEGLSRAYVQAIAAHCGMSSSSPTPDCGIDQCLHEIILVGSARIESGYRIDVQTKSTTLAHVDPTHVRYDLDVATYDLLRYPEAGCPRILVVLVMPEDESQWLIHSEEQLILRRCAYWLSLKGARPTTNRRTVRIKIPRPNVFSVASLRGMLDRIKLGEKI